VYPIPPTSSEMAVTHQLVRRPGIHGELGGDIAYPEQPTLWTSLMLLGRARTPGSLDHAQTASRPVTIAQPTDIDPAGHVTQHLSTLLKVEAPGVEPM